MKHLQEGDKIKIITEGEYHYFKKGDIATVINIRNKEVCAKVGNTSQHIRMKDFELYEEAKPMKPGDKFIVVSDSATIKTCIQVVWDIGDEVEFLEDDNNGRPGVIHGLFKDGMSWFIHVNDLKPKEEAKPTNDAKGLHAALTKKFEAGGSPFPTWNHEAKATDTQVGGDHYQMAIQPIDFIHANGIPYMEANVIKYVVRHKKKNGLQDLIKAKHYIDLLIQKEYTEYKLAE